MDKQFPATDRGSPEPQQLRFGQHGPKYTGALSMAVAAAALESRGPDLTVAAGEDTTVNFKGARK